MIKQRESSEIVKDRILKVATELFSKYGVSGVGIRRIADEAGINHALIIRYFGTKEKLITEILQRKISGLTSLYSEKPELSPVKRLEGLRKVLLNSITADESIMKLIVRTELDGLSPESYVDQSNGRPADLIAKWIASQQKDNNLPDAKLVAAIIMGAMFSMVSITPWLMTAVGLQKDDFERRKQDIVDVLIWIMSQAVGLPPDADVLDK